MSLVGCRWSNALLKFRLALQPTSHAPRAGRDDRNDHQRHHGHVSIHAPRAGCDKHSKPSTRQPPSLNPRAPRGARPPLDDRQIVRIGFNPRAPRGARRNYAGSANEILGFNPRAPRGARRKSGRSYCGQACFNPRAPRGARPAIWLPPSPTSRFNPRAPRGARQGVGAKEVAKILFQSTRPARGATHKSCKRAIADDVSIHAPRAGRDRAQLRYGRSAGRFNPRAPRGARQITTAQGGRSFRFQSTRPARGATPPACGTQRIKNVSIHAPRAGRDWSGTILR